MSIEAFNRAWNLEGLTPTRKLVLLCLANFADEKNTCYPSHGYIAKRVGLKDPKGVQRIIKELQSFGYLSIKPRFNKEGGQTSNLYTLHLPPYGTVATPPRVVEPPNTKEDTKDNKYSHQFQMFWKQYPRKVNKFGASKSFKRLSDKEKILAVKAAENFKLECDLLKTEEHFIPHAQTWLNNRRYEEHQQAPQPIKRTAGQIAG